MYLWANLQRFQIIVFRLYSKVSGKLNRADKDDLMALPGIGNVLAQRILEYRLAHGKFSSVEELMNVEGIGQKRLEQMLDLIAIGG